MSYVGLDPQAAGELGGHLDEAARGLESHPPLLEAGAKVAVIGGAVAIVSLGAACVVTPAGAWVAPAIAFGDEAVVGLSDGLPLEADLLASLAMRGSTSEMSSLPTSFDLTRVTIPAGKFGYLLEDPSKAGVFRGSMGFDGPSLDLALRVHLAQNLSTLSSVQPMVGGGLKFAVTGPLVGPSGAQWMITSVWGIDPDGTIRLITATP